MSKIQPWKEVSRELAFEKYSRGVEKVVFEMPDGSLEDFYIKSESMAACILAITSDNKIILVRQYRPGPQQIIVGLPGGYVDTGEVLKAAAQRELLEETGYEGDLEFVGAHLHDAYSTMERHCFVAKNCRKVCEPQRSTIEHTEVVIVSLKDFRNRLRKGRMTDVTAGYLGLDYLGLL
jgi:ADP-ribose pyrophosphatase